MGFGTGVAIYFVVWWTTLFITLPFQMRSQADSGCGHTRHRSRSP